MTMANYTIVLNVPGNRLPTIEKLANQAFGDMVRFVKKVDPEKSRADRLASIASDVESAASDIEELKDELQEWYDNLPENFQSGDKGSELEEAIQALDEIKDGLESVDFSSVSFPTMF